MQNNNMPVRHLPASSWADANSGANSLLAATRVSPPVAVLPLRMSSQVNASAVVPGSRDLNRDFKAF